VFILSLAGLASLAAVPQVQASAPPLATIVQQAKQGGRIAEFNLALLYAKGEDGLPKDPAEAVSWLRKSANQGYRKAEFDLALFYNGKDGFPKDPAKVVSWLRKSADQGYRRAECALAFLYDFGEDGLPKDPAKAASGYRKSADQGFPRAEFDLGVDYNNGGDGLPNDPVKATYWFERAAAQKFKPAIAALQAMRHPQQAVIARPAPQAADATAAPPADKERVAQSLQSFWDLYFRASNAQVVDFGAPALVRPVGFGE
jgi:TPR repeat protein